ncbi:MAG: hypothetical protein GEU26_09400 [Nitrososphaeraceae archaeon]|nr:hypothetical protein [Nitrososphaeraceae archaeon]
MVNVTMAGCGNVTGAMINECDACIPDNITIIPNYHISDSLTDQVSRCNYCGREWNEFWVSYSHVTLSLINQRQRQLKRGRIYVATDDKDSLLIGQH